MVYHQTFNSAAGDFYKNYHQKFDKYPGSILHALGYGNVYAIYYGLQTAGTNSDNKALADALRKIKYDSPLGTDASFDKTGQLQGASGRLAQVVDGKLEVDPANWTK